jgi:hypothetical protein
MDDMASRLEAEVQALLPGDRATARVKLLRKWLNGLFYGEEHFERRTHRSKVQAAANKVSPEEEEAL